MADRRMFTKKVTDDDNFMELSSAAQALYLHLSMNADDDGFCNQVTISMFKAHASVTDLQALLEKRYIYQFENGVIVIKHWRMANALRKDRYTPTVFQEELAKLELKSNGSYTRLPDGCQVVAGRLPQDSIGKISIDEDNIISSGEDNPPPPPPPKPKKKLKEETKHKYGEHNNVLLTDGEVEKLKERFGSSYMDKIDRLSNGIALKGYKYKSHYLAILSWFKEDAPPQTAEDLIMQGMSIVPVFKEQK